MWAVVTGASSGIGQASAIALARAGYDLILVARRKERLESFSRDIRALGRQVKTAALDVRDHKAVAALIESDPVFSQVDVLVNNAGLARGTEKLQDARPEDWNEMIDTNVKGLLSFTRLLLPGMIARRSGHIVNLGSVAGRWVYPGGAIYCATKFAVRALSDGLRMDVHGTGVRVTNIEPGMVKTEFSEVRFGSKSASDKVYSGMTPLTAEDIAETVVWCVQRPKHVNIQELVIFPTDQAAIGMVHRS